MLAAACSRPAPPRDLRLLELLASEVENPEVRRIRRVWTPDGMERVRLDQPQRVRVAGSDREVRITGRGCAWQAELPAGSGTQLELAAAALGPPGQSAGPVQVELMQDGRRRVLASWELAGGLPWERRRLELPPDAAGATLRLASAGRLPVAWSELFLDAGPEGAVDPRPDVVLMVIDTLRADHLSAYGYRRSTSPRLDRLARGGALFLQSSAAATWTLPSTASLFTGLPPDRHGVRTGADTLGADAVTLAEELRDLGYRTAAITDGGFVDPQWGLGQGFDSYETTPRRGHGRQRVRRGAAAARQFLEENRHRPFFLLLHTYETHQPYFNRDGFGDPFLAEIGAPGGDQSMGAGAGVRYDERELARAVALYDGEIRRVDHHFGQVLDRLEARSEPTAVLVTSDHGEEFQEHGDLDHFGGKLFEENVRVPLILWAPGVPAGRRVAAPASGLDVMPTLLALAGAPERAGALPGRSLLGLLSDSGGDEDRGLLVQGLSTPTVPREVRYRLDAGSKGGPRTVVHDAVRGETVGYDRAADPGMVRPGPPYPELVARLQALLAEGSGGQLAARLPPGAAGVEVPAGSRIVPVGLWDGLSWRPAAGPRLAATPGLPHCLVFRLKPGSGSLALRLLRPDGRAEEVTAAPLRRAPASVLAGLPPPLAVFRTAAALQPGRARLTSAKEAELRALGYLR